jgi:hypothetical protein
MNELNQATTPIPQTTSMTNIGSTSNVTSTSTSNVTSTSTSSGTSSVVHEYELDSETKKVELKLKLLEVENKRYEYEQRVRNLELDIKNKKIEHDIKALELKEKRLLLDFRKAEVDLKEQDLIMKQLESKRYSDTTEHMKNTGILNEKALLIRNLAQRFSLIQNLSLNFSNVNDVQTIMNISRLLGDNIDETDEKFLKYAEKVIKENTHNVHKNYI